MKDKGINIRTVWGISMIVVYLGMSFLLVFLLSGCKQKSYDIPGDTPTSGVIAIAIDECLSPIVEEEITVFESICKEAGIVPYFSGETETINRLLHDSTRLAVTTRLLTEQETAFMNAKKLFPKAIQIATDAIALIVNKQNTDSIIGLPVLKEVLTGKIQDWKSLSPANKLGKIDVVFDNPNSSTVRYAIDSICGGAKLNGQLQAADDSRKVLEYVAQTPGALGIIGVNWVSNPSDTTGLRFSDKIRVLAVSRYREATVANSFLPFQAYIALKDYPMTRPVYIILSEPRNGLASGFTAFVASDRGQRVILKSGILPATQVVRLINMRDEL